MIDADITRFMVNYFPGSMAKSIPDGEALAILIPGALDLVRRSGDTPDEVFWKGYFLHQLPH
jgi:hypothetical protein